MPARLRGVLRLSLLGSLIAVGTGNVAHAQLWGKPTSVERLALQLDQLEKEFDCYGSIVAKQPDIWGQARLTRHRFEYEEQMRAQLGAFEATLNASVFRSDQAFLFSAMSLGAAAGGRQAAIIAPGGTAAAQPPPNPELTVFNALLPGITSDVKTSTNTATGQTTYTTDSTVAQSKLTATPPLGVHQGFGTQNIKLEPTIHLDQMSRYLQHLHELRRINEGDDTADSPGYSLNLIRLPVSVVPGMKTRTGYGAEITVTATPYLSEELLPRTVRNLVINDLVDLLSMPIARQAAESYRICYEHRIPEYQADPSSQSTSSRGHSGSRRSKSRSNGDIQQVSGIQLTPAPIDEDAVTARESAITFPLQDLMYEAMRSAGGYDDRHQVPLSPVQKKAMNERYRKKAEVALRDATAHGRLRRNRSSLPPSQLSSVMGVDEMVDLGQICVIHLADSILKSSDGMPHLLDVRGFLREELDAAYDQLALAVNRGVWDTFASQTGMLAHHIRDLRVTEVNTARTNLIESLRAHTGLPGPGSPGSPDDHKMDARIRITRILAWAILVESALLNERLTDDMKRIAAERGCPCVPPVDGMQLCIPEPPFEARHAFNEYVKCRWPIHVFAIDPMTQDQNVADSFSRRRELQLALALSFASGRMSANSMTRFARRLELDMETIALNRTVVGFSHGNDTFGWRFYPRVQSPPEKSNMDVMFRELLVGGPSRDDDLRQRQLEPGMRECVAVVIMPSFVPYVTLDTRSSWFGLTNCKPSGWSLAKPEVSVRESMRMSKKVRSMQDTYAECVRDADQYRDGDVWRLLKRADQLSARLPFQTQRAQVPFENSLGGFEIFSDGTSDLGPQLRGFYGEPGIDVNGETRIFVIGDHFSVHDTRVIAGNKSVHHHLISRQIMEVTIPPGVRTQTVNHKFRKVKETGQPEPVPVVDLHVATPYGVSNHLEIPVVESKTPASSLFRWGTTESLVTYTYNKAAGVFTFKAAQPSLPNELLIEGPPGTVDLGPATVELVVATADNVIIPGTIAAMKGVAYDTRRRSYVIDASKLKTFHEAFAASLLTHVTKGGNDPPPFVELRIVCRLSEIAGVANAPPVEGSTTLTVKLKQE